MASSNDEDCALSQRSAQGDSAAFAMLVEKYERPLRAFLARMGAGAAADDFAQEAFFKAWRAAGQYDGRARYSTWLTKIAWRCQIDHARRHRPVEAELDSGPGMSGDEVWDMLDRLSHSERAALVLCEGHGWTHAEAADFLGLPLGTLKSTVARAKTKCRQIWNEESHD